MTSLASRLRQFGKSTSGASAIEFSFLVPIVLSLTFSALELGWVMTKKVLLDRAVEMTMRDVRLGVKEDFTEDSLRKDVCDLAMILSDCKNNLLIEMTPITSKADFPNTTSPCVNRKTNIDPVHSFDQGKPDQIVYVRICAVVDPFVTLIGLGLALPKDASGGFQLLSASAFLNEV